MPNNILIPFVFKWILTSLTLEGCPGLTGEASLEEASTLSTNEILARMTKRRRIEPASSLLSAEATFIPKATKAPAKTLVVSSAFPATSEPDYCVEILRVILYHLSFSLEFFSYE